MVYPDHLHVCSGSRKRVNSGLIYGTPLPPTKDTYDGYQHRFGARSIAHRCRTQRLCGGSGLTGALYYSCRKTTTTLSTQSAQPTKSSACLQARRSDHSIRKLWRLLKLIFSMPHTRKSAIVTRMTQSSEYDTNKANGNSTTVPSTHTLQPRLENRHLRGKRADHFTTSGS